jgi:uncharacterized protein YlbG (UPF0298 family)
MRLASAEHPALASTLVDLVTKHDFNQKPESSFKSTRHLQDFGTVTYTVVADRKADDRCCTCITIKATWPSDLEIDTAVVVRILQRVAPGSLSLHSSGEDITVTWLLGGSLYLDGLGVERTRTVIAWISKLRCALRTLRAFTRVLHVPKSFASSQAFIMYVYMQSATSDFRRFHQISVQHHFSS